MTGTAGQTPFFVIFDTSTHARYYSDVHELMALPAGAIIRYEYKRYLCKQNASAALDALIDNPSALPTDALLMYGEKHSFRKGDPDPTEMLRRADSVFIPTRSCRIVNVAKIVAPNRDDDVLHIHLQVHGFVDPEAPAIDALVAALETQDALPFGERGKQNSWVALLPNEQAAQRPNLVTENSVNWSKAVDAMILRGTQFQHDVFWRVAEVREIAKSGDAKPLRLIKRPNNKHGDTDRWHMDYELHELKKYEIVVETHSPSGHGHEVPGDATAALTALDDEGALLRLPASPADLVPNQSATTKFSVGASLTIGARHPALKLETQTAGANGPYPPGSSCALTVALSKERWRLFGGSALLLAAAVCGVLGATYGDDNIGLAFLAGVGALLAASLAYWLFRGEIKLGS